MSAAGADDPRARAVRREWVRRTRRHPSRTQHDYLHLRRLLDDLSRALADLALPAAPDVLDLYCGARPYDDLLPPGARVVSLDVVDEYGVADIVSSAFLPFEDHRFDLVLCTQALYYAPDPATAVAEIGRILRPGGVLVATVPHVQEYARATRERRFTGPELHHLFSSWEDVEVVESGNRAVTWTTITGRILLDLERASSRGPASARAMRIAGPAMHVVLNTAGVLLERLDRRIAKPGHALPCALLVSARSPVAAAAREHPPRPSG